MTAIGDPPDMDVYAAEIAAHAAHPASARLFRQAQDKRPGRNDIITGEFTPYTDEEIEQDRLDRRITIASVGLFALVMVVGAVGYWLGWLAGTGRLS